MGTDTTRLVPMTRDGIGQQLVRARFLSAKARTKEANNTARSLISLLEDQLLAYEDAPADPVGRLASAYLELTPEEAREQAAALLRWALGYPDGLPQEKRP